MSTSNELTEPGAEIDTKFEVTVKLKFCHAKILELVKKYGSIKALAREIGISESTLGGWLNMRKVPACGRELSTSTRRTARARKITSKAVVRLCELTQCTPEELFPGYIREHLSVFAPKTTTVALTAPVVRQLSQKQAGRLPSPTASRSTAELQELRQRIEEVLPTLSYREREIIKLRYGLGDGYSYTLEEVGHIFKTTRERIRQIEAKAIRKLQQPSRSQQLVGFLDE